MVVAGLWLAFAPGVLAAESGSLLQDPTLAEGYRAMYGLDFAAADQRFVAFQREYPQSPMGPVSRSAAILFRELDRLAILQSRLFQDDAFVKGKKPEPDPTLGVRFREGVDESDRLATKVLAERPDDRDALFAMTLANGLRSDYLSLVENRNMAALSYTREATRWAGKLLAVAPDCYDAHLAIGVSHYIIGSLPAPFRWVLRLGGYSGDKSEGIREVELTAQRGKLLAPFARILLAVADLRDGNRNGARQILVGLQREFPSNPLFARELRRLDGTPPAP